MGEVIRVVIANLKGEVIAVVIGYFVQLWVSYGSLEGVLIVSM